MPSHLPQRSEAAEEAAEANGLEGLPYAMPTTSDTAVRAFRRFWKKSGLAANPLFGAAAAADLDWESRTAQYDRWESHTKHCADCTRALTRAKVLRTWSVLAALLPVALGASSAVRMAGVAVFVAARFAAIKVVDMLEGKPTPHDLGLRLKLPGDK